MLKGIRKLDDFSANCLFRWKWRLKRGGPHMVVYRGTISPDAIGNPMCQYGRNEMNRRHPLRKGRGFFCAVAAEAALDIRKCNLLPFGWVTTKMSVYL